MKYYIDETGAVGSLKKKDEIANYYRNSAYIGSYIAIIAKIEDEDEVRKKILELKKEIKVSKEIKSSIFGKTENWLDKLQDMHISRIKKFVEIIGNNKIEFSSIFIPIREHVYELMFHYFFIHKEEEGLNGLSWYREINDWMMLCIKIIDDKSIEVNIMENNFHLAEKKIKKFIANFIRVNTAHVLQVLDNNNTDFEGMQNIIRNNPYNTIDQITINYELCLHFILMFDDRVNKEVVYNPDFRYDHVGQALLTEISKRGEEEYSVILDNEPSTYKKIIEYVSPIEQRDSKSDDLLAIPDLICGLYGRVFKVISSSLEIEYEELEKQILNLNEIKFIAIKEISKLLEYNNSYKVNYDYDCIVFYAVLNFIRSFSTFNEYENNLDKKNNFRYCINQININYLEAFEEEEMKSIYSETEKELKLMDFMKKY